MRFLAKKQQFFGENEVFSGENRGKKSKIACICHFFVVTLHHEMKNKEAPS